MIKIGVIGAGKWGLNHLKDFSRIKNCQLVGLADSDTNKKSLADNFNISFFPDFKEMLNQVDAVTIVTPTTTHYEIAKICLENNKHVFVEKPLCLNLDEAEYLVKLANSKNLFLSVGYVFRFNPLVRRLRQLIPEIGPIQYISGSYVHSSVPPRKDSGVIFNLGIHLIDLLNYILPEKPKNIFCKKVNHISPKNEDSAFINLDYGGFLANLEVSCCHPLKKRDLWVIGAKEKLYLDLLDQTLIHYPIEVSENGSTIKESYRDPMIEKTSPLSEELAHFCYICDEMMNGNKWDNESAENLLTTRLCILALNSSKDNCVMDIKDNDLGEVKISKTAIVKNAKIGKGTKIWEYANVYGCEIGENCMVGSYVEIQPDVKIGNNVRVQTHSFLCSKVTIEDDVFIGHGVKTINDLVPPSRDSAKWKPTLIKRGASIGSNATLLPVIIGENALVGAGAVVTRDVPDNCVVVGNPARIIRKRFS